MSVTLADDVTPITITLPIDLQWVDEFTWLPTAQQVDFGLDGAMIVEESAQQSGRPITLQGARTFAWILRSVLADLYTLAGTPRDTPMVLTLLDGRTFNVLFRHGTQPAVEAAPIIDQVPFDDGDAYTLILRLMQV